MNFSDWADDFLLAENYSWDAEIEAKKESGRQKSKKYYWEKIGKYKVIVFCKFCNKNHEILRISRDRNIKKNGRYICHKENAHRPKPRKKKINEFADIEMKECSISKKILSFKLFNKDISHKDGLRSACRDCEYERRYGKKRKK